MYSLYFLAKTPFEMQILTYLGATFGLQMFSLVPGSNLSSGLKTFIITVRDIFSIYASVQSSRLCTCT